MEGPLFSNKPKYPTLRVADLQVVGEVINTPGVFEVYTLLGARDKFHGPVLWRVAAPLLLDLRRGRVQLMTLRTGVLAGLVLVLSVTPFIHTNTTLRQYHLPARRCNLII